MNGSNPVSEQIFLGDLNFGQKARPSTKTVTTIVDNGTHNVTYYKVEYDYQYDTTTVNSNGTITSTGNSNSDILLNKTQSWKYLENLGFVSAFESKPRASDYPHGFAQDTTGCWRRNLSQDSSADPNTLLFGSPVPPAGQMAAFAQPTSNCSDPTRP